MTIAITIAESVNTDDRLNPPASIVSKIVQQLSINTARDGVLSINVPENLNIQDNLGSYKPWFNGMKHFYTVKSLPPKKQ